MSDYYSLSCLMPENGMFNGIRVPSVQRAYVQGRDDALGRRARNNFMPELLNAAIKDETKPAKGKFLHLIYGIKASDGAFLPIDGQQRLTTLFLLAWVFRKIGGKWKFEYESRREATFFLRGLLTAEPPQKGTDLLEFLRDQSWYMPAWENDPSVSGMIEMLKAIITKRDRIQKEKESGNIEIDLESIRFEVKEIGVNDATYSEIFLKMNARGKPLTNWENLKAILDDHLFDNIRQGWRSDIDNAWPNAIWKRLPGNGGEIKIGQLNNVMEKVVRIAYVSAKTLSNSSNPSEADQVDFNVESYRLDNWLRNAPQETFYALATKMFSRIADNWDSMAAMWSNESRQENKAWETPPEKETSLEKWDKAKFQNWICGGDHTYREMLRFVFLVKFHSQNIKNLRRLRVLLNLLDATEFSSENFSKALISGIGFLEGDNTDALSSLDGFKASQIEDEKIKWKLDENEIAKLEKHPLAYQGSLRFLEWQGNEQINDLQSRLSKFETQINDDWISLYCRILAWQKRGANNELLRQFHIPYNEPWRWGKFIFSENHVIKALVDISKGGHEPDHPAWLNHFEELAKGERLGGKHGLRSFDRWTYVVPEVKRVPRSIRLDFNGTECKNRELLKDEIIYFGESDARYLPRDAKEDGKGYNVWADSWYNSNNPPTIFRNQEGKWPDE